MKHQDDPEEIISELLRASPTIPRQCPSCGSKRIPPVLFGLPTPEAGEVADLGRIAIGGCCLPEEGEDGWFECLDCGHRWQATESSPDDR